MVVNRCCVGPDLKEEKERAMQSRWRGVPDTGSACGPTARASLALRCVWGVEVVWGRGRARLMQSL